MTILISLEISPKKLHGIFINSLIFKSSTTFAVNKQRTTTAVPAWPQHRHARAWHRQPLLLFGAACFMLYSSLLCSPGV